MTNLDQSKEKKSIKLKDFYGLFVVLLVFVGIFIGLTPFQPPEPGDYKGLEAEVSLEEIKGHLNEIAQKPHPVGSDEHERVKNYLVQSLEEMGLTVEIQDTLTYKPGTEAVSRVQNILTKIEGEDSTGTVMLAAHYDTSFASPGASDDGYGVAALVEAARLLKDKSLKNDVIILITDAEELGLIGAHAFVNEHPWAKDVDVVLNFEARGNTGSTVMFETSNGNENLIKEFKEGAGNPVSNSFLKEVYEVMPNGTDLTEFVNFGMQGLNFASAQGLNGYHTTIDSLKYMNENTVLHHATYAYALAFHLSSIDLQKIESDSSDNAVYFNLFGHTFVSYSQSLVLPLFILVAIGLLATIYHGIRRKLISNGGSLLGFLLFIVSLVAAYGISLFIKNITFAVLRNKEWLLIYDQEIAWTFLLGILIVTFAFLVLLTNLVLKKIKAFHMVIGALFGWLLIAGATSFLMPGASYLFVWPLSFALIGLNLVFWKNTKLSKENKIFVYTLFLVPGMVLYTFLVNTIHLALTLDVVQMVMVVAALGFMLLIPAFSKLEGSPKYALGLLILGATLITSKSINLEANMPHPIGNQVYYLADADMEQAVWGLDSEPDSFTSQFVPIGTELGSLDALPAFNIRNEMYIHTAPYYDTHLPESTLVSDITNNGLRTITLDISSPDATILSMRTKSNITIHNLKVNDKVFEFDAIEYSKDIPFYNDFIGLSDGFQLSITIDEGETLEFNLISKMYEIPSEYEYEERPEHMTTHTDYYQVSKTFTY